MFVVVCLSGILSYIMCKAMNRSLASVLFGGYANKNVRNEAERQVGVYKETWPDQATESIVNSKEVIIVPGYGMAVAKAQYALAELAKTLRENNVRVRFAVHPVAGRMPGQMNVLLAEAGTVPGSGYRAILVLYRCSLRLGSRNG